MAEGKPIEVIVKDERTQETVQGGGGSNVKTPDSLPNQQAKSNKSTGMALTIGTMIAMRAVSYATSNVGKWTGNSRNQRIVNDATKAVGYAAAFAANVYVGIATVALDVGSTAMNYLFDNYWQQQASEQARAKFGGRGGYRK